LSISRKTYNKHKLDFYENVHNPDPILKEVA